MIFCNPKIVIQCLWMANEMHVLIDHQVLALACSCWLCSDANVKMSNTNTSNVHKIASTLIRCTQPVFTALTWALWAVCVSLSGEEHRGGRGCSASHSQEGEACREESVHDQCDDEVGRVQALIQLIWENISPNYYRTQKGRQLTKKLTLNQ